MMRLLCDGVALDLYDNAGLQFTHKNPLFAFDDLECERTTQFKLPCTPTNDGVLSLARVPAYKGTGMRRKFSAQLQAGTVVKDGYLYVTDFDGTDYNAIFVTGDLVQLQAIKEDGNARDILQYDDKISWLSANFKDANRNDLQGIDLVKGAPTPSVNLLWLIQQIVTSVGVTVDATNLASISGVRIFYADDKLTISDTDIHLANDPHGQDAINLRTFLGLCNIGIGASVARDVPAVQDQYLEWDWGNSTVVGQSQFNTISVPYDISIEFPQDFPDNWMLLKGVNIDPYDFYRNHWYGWSNYLGTRWMDEYGDMHGDPLAGTKVQIPANTAFMLIKGGLMTHPDPRDPQYVGQVGRFSYEEADLGEYDFKVRITVDHEWVAGEDVPYNAVLPDASFTDLLKLAAYLSGTLLNFEDGVVLFETLASLTDEQYLTKLTNRGEVRRVFSDYARNNYVRFRDDPAVTPSAKQVINYTVDNDTLDEKKELAELIASEGATGNTPSEGLVVKNCATDVYMVRCVLPKNTRLQDICGESTQIKVGARMTLAQYAGVRTRSVLYVDNSRYLWTERSWDNDTAQFTLAKLP